MSHDDLLRLYLKRTTGTSRTVAVSGELAEGEIKVTRTTLILSPSFISPDTDLPDLASRCSSLEEDYDTKEERERERVASELEHIILSRFAHLVRLDPERASTLISELEDVQELQAPSHNGR